MALWAGSPIPWPKRRGRCSARSRTEVVATFLAVLELCKNHRLRLSGDGENCTVTYVENPPPSGPENNG